MVVEPKESANSAEKSKLLNMESRLKKRIVGQDAAISSICRAIRRSRAGFKDPARPVGSFIFLGTSGIGKTELCKALAAVLYGSEKKLLKFDMSECMHAHDSSRLTGSAPGYVGYENGGQLTNAVKQNPSAVLCLDEIEKANPDVLNLFLQIMEDGVLTSGQGEKISFADILIIMTSNIGAEEIVRESKPIGFSDGYDEEADVKYKITDVMKNTFKPEFLNRIDEIITFERLGEKHVLQICNIMLGKVKSRAGKLNIKLDFDKSAVAQLARLGFDREYGARPLRRVISAKIEDMLSEKVIGGELNAGDDIRVAFKKKRFVIENKKAAQAERLEQGYEEMY